ncbi:MAG: T9SS type A sorting domain-containing protein [Saprospiraceae bacterium]
MNNFTLPLLICIGFFTSSQAQSIFDNPITGTNPNTANPYTTGQTFDPNITVSGIGRGTGISGTNANNRYNANSWNTADIDLDAYFEWILTPNSGQKINFASLDYTGQVSATGPISFAVRSSLDNYASDIATPTIDNDATPHSGQIDLSASTFDNITSAITFRFYGWDASAGGGTFSINDFLFNGAVTLPIELLYFKSKSDNGATELTWSTATEIDNDYFSIQRSTNGHIFSEIGQERGAGTSYEPQDYIFTDERPLQGKNYYRLKQVDFDGKYSYSQVVTATFSKTSLMTLAPVPAVETLNIQLEKPSNDDGNWQVYDLNGRLLLSGEMLAETTGQSVHIAELPEGAYVLRLTVGQEVMVEQFWKQD